MNSESSSISLGSICVGCLSEDRKLTRILRDEIIILFCDILESLDIINHPLLLCWECAAFVNKTLCFKKQVKRAYEYLISYVNQKSKLTTLSNIKVSKTTTIEISGSLKSVVNAEELQETKVEGQHYPKTKKNKRCNRNDRNLKKEFETQPLTFIKIEDDNDIGSDIEFGEDLEGCYVDDDLKKDGDIDDTDLKAVLKLDPSESCQSSKTKERKLKTKVDDFSDSDDEPLNNKKRKTEDTKEYKPRGRRKKEVIDGPKIDKRKHPKPKREKPSGVVNNSRVNKKLQQLNVGSGLLEMVVLSWEEVEAERQKALNNIVFTRHEYRCYDCVLGFNHKFKLENHMKKHDPASGSVTCSVCRVRCRDPHALCAHRRRHRVRWRCTACGAAWSRAGVAADHATRAHGAPPPTHTCAVCGHCEPTLAKLRNHLKNHAERQKCEICGKTFRDRTSLRTHLFIHKGEKEYACRVCGKRFLFKKAMEVHLVTHDAHQHLYCLQCDMNFKNHMSYYQHMKYNLKHIDPAKLKYACAVCEKKFAKAARLREHELAVHLRATPLRCAAPGCCFACSSRPVLRTHVRMVHRNARALRNHVCDTCGKAYTTKKTLEGHMRSHTGERPFACGRCPSTFGYEAALYNHNKLVHLQPKVGRGKTRAAPASGPAPHPPPHPAGGSAPPPGVPAPPPGAPAAPSGDPEPTWPLALSVADRPTTSNIT